MNNLDSLINFLGWAALTYYWLHINITFASAIRQAIEDHNDDMRDKGYVDGYDDCAKNNKLADS